MTSWRDRISRRPVDDETRDEGSAPPLLADSVTRADGPIDLRRRREQLKTRVTELQFDLGGLVYEMVVRDRMRPEVLVQRAVVLQDADAELSEVERLIRLDETSTAGACANCGSPHSSGASFCWQCGQPLLPQVSADAVSSSAQ